MRFYIFTFHFFSQIHSTTKIRRQIMRIWNCFRRKFNNFFEFHICFKKFLNSLQNWPGTLLSEAACVHLKSHKKSGQSIYRLTLISHKKSRPRFSYESPLELSGFRFSNFFNYHKKEQEKRNFSFQFFAKQLRRIFL